MGNLLDMVVRQVKEFFGRLTRGQIIRMGILVLLCIAIAIVAAMMFGREEYTILYSNSDEKSTAAVYDELVASGAPVQVRDDGALWVPTSQAETLRLQLASKNLLSSGFTYEIAEKGMGIGSTTAEQKAMQAYQLEQNVRATLMHMNRIQNATVMLTQPDSSPFVLERDSAKPTAAISVEVVGGERLTALEVQAIANLVSSAVKDLKPEDVSIVDTNMHYYPLEDEVSNASEDIMKQYNLEQTVQKRLEDQAIKLLSPIFGPEKVSVGVSVHLNFDKKQQQSTILEPPVADAGNNGIIISMKELQETIRGDTTAAGQPGQDTNGGLPTYPYAAEDGAGEPYNHFEREMNMEVNEIKTMIDMAQGQIEDLSVGVIIDNAVAEDYSAQVKALVANALGIKDKTRITVTRMPFMPADTSAIDANQKLVSDAQRNELIKLGIIVLAALIVLFLLFKLIRDVMRPRNVVVAANEDAPPVYDMPEDAVEGVDYVVDDEGNIIPMPESEDGGYGYETERRKNEKQAFVEKLIQEDPEIAAQLLRTWLMEE